VEQPLVSVVIPVFNIEAHLEQCLDSVVGQTLKDIEIICVDDGSTDSSPQILERYAQRDSRVRIITQANAGPGAARNTGLAKATGTYLIFLDSDDWFEPDFLERMVKRAEETDADVTICRAVEFDTQTGQELSSEWMLKSQYLPGETFSPHEIADHIFQFAYGMPWDKFYRASYIKTEQLTFPPLQNSEDLAFVFPSILSAERITVVNCVFVHHRVNRTASVSNSRAAQPEAPYQAFQIVKSYLEEHGLMDTYERSFLNWAMEFLVWHICNIPEVHIQKQYCLIFRKKWISQLGFEQHPLSYYRDKKCYMKYLLARYMPCPILRWIINRYKAGKRLSQRLT